jgi:hypothetical protein
MDEGIRTLTRINSVRPKHTTDTIFVTTIIIKISIRIFIILLINIFSLMVKYRFSAPYDIGSNPIRC